jgi:quercetin dioxygenase-like cupin family protein
MSIVWQTAVPSRTTGAHGALNAQLTLRNTVPGPGSSSATTALRIALVTPPWTTIPVRGEQPQRVRRRPRRPHSETAVHHADTLDLETVLTGSVDLLLDDGVHHLEEGDMVVMTGVDHAWKAGPDGCRINAILIGTATPE